MPVELIKKKIKELAKINGFKLSDNVDKIINAKIRFFGEDEWYKCPCERENESRFCCSQLCQTDVRTKGECHCRLFLRKE